MAATVRDETIPRSLMFLFLGASVVLLAIQWRAWAINSQSEQAKEPVQKEIVGTKPITQAKMFEPLIQRTQPKVESPKPQTISTRSKMPAVKTAAVKAPKVKASEAKVAEIKATEIKATEVKVAETEAVVPVAVSQLVVDLSDRQVHVYQGDKVRTSYPLAVGQEGWETPTGSFEVIEMQRNPQWLHPITKEVVPPGPDNPLGKRWIGFWANEKTHLGFHGTNQEELIGQAVSHGCLRMRNQDVIALYEQVKPGTPVIVRQ